MTEEKKFPIKNTDIFTFIPNLIGYGRVLTLLASWLTMKSYPLITMLAFYSTSCLLDAFDGAAARKYGQSTKFGAVLDMVTDRSSTCSLIVFLGIIYPDWCILWQFLISLDLSSHYMHMYAMITSGASSHKSVSKDSNILMRLYYTNRKILFTVCAFNELFYIALYFAHYDLGNFPGTSIPTGVMLAYISAPTWIFKQIMNVIQMVNAALMMSHLDAQQYNKLHKLIW